MFNEYKYKAAWCPVCKQGCIEFVKEEKTGLLFLLCDECEAEWTTPEDIGVQGKGSRCKFGKVIEPTEEEILSKGWGKYIKK